MVHPTVANGVFVALKIMYNMGLSSSPSSSGTAWTSRCCRSYLATGTSTGL